MEIDVSEYATVLPDDTLQTLSDGDTITIFPDDKPLSFVVEAGVVDVPNKHAKRVLAVIPGSRAVEQTTT